MIELTKNAAEFIQKSNVDVTPYFRIRVVSGGCGGMQYRMEFETEKNEGDQEFEQHGLKILVDTKSLLFVAGSEIDFSNDMLNGGLKISNPNSKSACGCGKSFEPT